MSEKGVKFTLHITSIADLNRDVLKVCILHHFIEFFCCDFCNCYTCNYLKCSYLKWTSIIMDTLGPFDFDYIFLL